EEQESRTTLSQGGGDDVVRPTASTPSGPMTRARVKAIHAKVNSLLSMCDLDNPLNGLLLHSDTLCVLSYGGPDDPYEDLQESDEYGQEARQEDEAAAQWYYRQDGRYYRQGPRCNPGEAEEPCDAPGSGTTDTTSGTTA